MPLDPVTAIAAVETLLRTEWVVQGESSTYFTREDQELDTPSAKRWARMTMREALGNLAELSGTNFRRESLLSVQVFTVLDDFDPTLTIADALRRVLESATGQPWFRDVTLTPVGVDEFFDNYFRIDVTATAIYDDVRV